MRRQKKRLTLSFGSCCVKNPLQTFLLSKSRPISLISCFTRLKAHSRCDYVSNYCLILFSHQSYYLIILLLISTYTMKQISICLMKKCFFSHVVIYVLSYFVETAQLLDKPLMIASYPVLSFSTILLSLAVSYKCAPRKNSNLAFMLSIQEYLAVHAP